MTKYTPGPWVVLGSRVQLNDVCFVASTNRDYPLSPSNARLISAAPDMLAALRAIAEELPRLNSPSKRVKESAKNAINGWLETAIRRAEGGE